MLFLYRPRQTWLPVARPMANTEQAEYARHLNAQFEATQRRPAALPAGPAPVAASGSNAGGHDVVRALQDLVALHEAGHVTDDEFARAKAQVLGG